MKPYYVMVAVGGVDATGAPEKFGLLGADSPDEAELLVKQVAAQHQQEPCSIAVLQLYRSYPGTLLKALVQAEEARALLESDNAELHEIRERQLDEMNRQSDEIYRLEQELKAARRPQRKSRRKKRE